MIKKILGFELCNEFSINDLDPASYFLKKLLKLELVESADIQALRIEVPLLKEKLNRFYQESKVSHRAITLKTRKSRI